jgi:DNA polymerase-3 subunit epsilon
MPRTATSQRSLGQRSFDDLGTPLFDVTFCVLDLETTGASATDCEITEIGAVKLRGGECLGTFHTLVNPGTPIPPLITYLTGITEAMVMPAPRINQVLPSLVEFIGDAVIVGHNIRFDMSFLQAALARTGRQQLTNRTVDTCALARRLVRDEVPNCQLGTLAERFRLDHRPTHRALDDALATADLLHLLLERTGTLGVTGLDDLLSLPTIDGHAQANKLRLTAPLPRKPGVYLFRDRHRRVLYVGKATNLRARVRSYFSSDERRKVGQLLRETEYIDHIVCTHPLHAAVLEVRLIHELAPRFNRQAKDWKKYCYVKLTLDERFPRLAIARAARDDGAIYLGPLSSQRAAQRVIEAIQTVVPLRRCTTRISRSATSVRDGPCSAAQLGVALCPCSGTVSERDYAKVVETAVRGLTGESELLLEPLRQRMLTLARAERFEEAADTRDRAEALAAALRRQQRLDALIRAGRLVLEWPDGSGAELQRGRLTRTWPAPGDRATNHPALHPSLFGDNALAADGHASATGRLTVPEPGRPLPRELADELACVATLLDRAATRVRLVHAERGLRSAWPPVPTFAAGGRHSPPSR